MTEIVKKEEQFGCFRSVCVDNDNYHSITRSAKNMLQISSGKYVSRIGGSEIYQVVESGRSKWVSFSDWDLF